MHKIYERIVSPDEIELTSKLKNPDVPLGKENKKEQSGKITGYCHKVITNEKGELIEFRVLVPDFDTCSKMKEYYIPEWRIQNTFGFTPSIIEGKYVILSGETTNLKVEIM